MSLYEVVKLILISCFVLILSSCSASYKTLSNIEISEGNNFQEYLLYEYSEKAKFEAEEMHDWNSAKLYSEKALRALSGENIYPEKITYWNLPTEIVKDIRSDYNHLLSMYDEESITDTKNLEKDISY